MPWENDEEICDCGHLKSAHLSDGSCCAVVKDGNGVCPCTKFHKSREGVKAAAKRIKQAEDEVWKRIDEMDFTEKEGIV